MATRADIPRLFLERQGGPPVPVMELGGDGVSTLVLGRSPTCGLVLPDDSVSRHHAQLHTDRGVWVLVDLGSRLGTMLNGVKLEPLRAVPVHRGDYIRVGPWDFRLTDPDDESETRHTSDDGVSAQVSTIHEGRGGTLAADRLRLLMRCASELSAAVTERDWAEKLLDTAMKGTGVARGAVVRTAAGASDAEVIVAQPMDRSGHGPPALSRSVLNASSAGRAVWLNGRSRTVGGDGESILRLGITSAACAPVMLGATVAAHLYLDSRGREPEVTEEAAMFCGAVAHLGGLALASIKRAELERRQSLFEEELAVARRAQRLILPAELGTVGPISYAMRMTPGLTLAGDLFDVVPLGSRRTAVVLGDVTGKGVGAALMMAAAQSFLRAALASHELSRAVSLTNQYVAERMPGDRFISIWVGVFEEGRREVRYVDAGHGLWLIRGNSGNCRRVRGPGGIPLGIEMNFCYEDAGEAIQSGDRVLLFSDGATDQRSPEGKMFGVDGLSAVLGESPDAQTDVASVFAAIEKHAQSWSLTDDTTVASVTCERW